MTELTRWTFRGMFRMLNDPFALVIGMRYLVDVMKDLDRVPMHSLKTFPL